MTKFVQIVLIKIPTKYHSKKLKIIPQSLHSCTFEILGLQPRICKDFLFHYNIFSRSRREQFWKQNTISKSWKYFYTVYMLSNQIIIDLMHIKQERCEIVSSWSRELDYFKYFRIQILCLFGWNRKFLTNLIFVSIWFSCQFSFHINLIFISI